MFARIVVKSLKVTITKIENTVAMSATSTIDLKTRKENPSMTSEQFESEKEYQVRMSIMRTMLKIGLITKSEYDKIDTNFLKKYSPIFDDLYGQCPKKFANNLYKNIHLFTKKFDYIKSNIHQKWLDAGGYKR